MSDAVLFAIGTVIFFAVATAVFLYGLAIFRDLQVRDETATRAWDDEHPSAPTATNEPVATDEPPDTLNP